jgi:hypothetical protein
VTTVTPLAESPLPFSGRCPFLALFLVAGLILQIVMDGVIRNAVTLPESRLNQFIREHIKRSAAPDRH